MAEMQTQLRLLTLTTPIGRSFLPSAVAQGELCLHVVYFDGGPRTGRAIEGHGPRRARWAGHMPPVLWGVPPSSPGLFMLSSGYLGPTPDVAGFVALFPACGAGPLVSTDDTEVRGSRRRSKPFGFASVGCESHPNRRCRNLSI